ncbi:tetratricopeptide repeat protein [Myxococcus stipitatus]|uniref:protein kinase domain-containing protein n=1 Tax=Myxococcus stipitatus TaxID=83455 RepID=UPI003144E43A
MSGEPARGAEVSPSRSCPRDATLAEFREGGLSEELRAHVLAHVEGCAACQSALAVGASARALLPSGSAPPVEATFHSLEPGSRVGRYVVRERLGAGAMGVVYAAEDPELGRRVALKMLHPEGHQREKLRKRLLREAQALARLSHPNIVTLYDVGTHGDAVFLTMELVEGVTLAEWMRESRPWKDVLRVFLDAGKGLAAAHAAGLVHRDFKPANTLLGKEGRVFVTDFGIAGELHPEAGPPLPEDDKASVMPWGSLTRTGQLMGTPAYLAPELVIGQHADARSDEFSFCVALYEALFGVRPFQGETFQEVINAALQGRVSPPKDGVKVPSRVRRAVLRGLRPRPEERFPSMQALLAALAPPPHRRVLPWAAAAATGLLGALVAHGVSVAHQHESRCEQEVEKLAAAWSPARRERIRAAFLATDTAYAAASWERLGVTLDAYADQWRTLRTESCLSTESGTTDTAAWQTAACLDARLWQFAATTQVLENADALIVQNAPQLTASLEGLAGCRDAPGLSGRPQPPDALRPRVDAARHTLAQARAHYLAGRYRESLAVTTALLEDIKGLDYKPLTAEVLLLHGTSHGDIDQPKEAEEFLDQALWAAEAGRDDEMVARAWLELIWVVGESLSRPADGEKIVRHAQAAVERLGRERFPDITSELHLRVSALRYQQSRYGEAEQEALQGLEFSRARMGPDSLRTAQFLHQLARVRMFQLRRKEALDLHLQAFEVRKRLLGHDNPALMASYDRVAASYQGLGRHEEAIDIWRGALALQNAAPGEENLVVATMLLNLALSVRVSGHLEEARPLLERARAIFARIRGADHYLVAGVIVEQAILEGDLGENDKAIALATDAVERIQRSMGADAPRAAMSLTTRGAAHLAAGHYLEARRDLQDALHRVEASEGEGAATSLEVLLPLAKVALALKAPKEGLEYCERARKLTEKIQSQESEDGANALTCVGEAYLASGSVDKSLPQLERAWRILTQMEGQGDPLAVGHTAFVLARARMEARPSPDRAGALEMAEEARTRLESVGIRGRRELEKVLAWRRLQGI